MAEVAGVTDLWQSVVNRLNQDDRLTPQLLGFISLVEPKGVLGETLYIEVPNDLAREMIDRRMRPAVQDAISAFGSSATGFAVVVNPDMITALPNETQDDEPVQAAVPSYLSGSSQTSSPSVSSTGRSAGSVDETKLNPKYTFDNFVTGGSNRFAHAAAFAVAETPAKAYNPLFIYGSSGLGKTHLLHAIGHYALNLYPRIKVRYVSSEEFTNNFINAIQNNRAAEFQATYRDVDVLLIDDIQFLQGKDQTQEAFFHTFNSLHDHNKQVVITSDLQPKELTGFEERLVSRFEWGLLTDIQAPELETRIAILRKKSENDKLRVPDDVLEYMAARVSSNIRELEGTLNRVTAYAGLNRQRVDMALVQAVLKDVVPLGEDRVIAPIEIINAVASYYKLTVDDIFGRSRTSVIAQARQIAMYICREQTNLSLPKIGAIFGGRDHTTVMYANDKVAALMKERRNVYNQVSEILTKVKTESR